MQLSYDSRGNSVPTILLLMQRHLYAQGGLQVHGLVIFSVANADVKEWGIRDKKGKFLDDFAFVLFIIS